MNTNEQVVPIWHDVNEKLPERINRNKYSEIVLVREEYGYMHDDVYNFVGDFWQDAVLPVTHWCVKPKDPIL